MQMRGDRQLQQVCKQPAAHCLAVSWAQCNTCIFIVTYLLALLSIQSYLSLSFFSYSSAAP